MWGKCLWKSVAAIIACFVFPVARQRCTCWLDHTSAKERFFYVRPHHSSAVNQTWNKSYFNWKEERNDFHCLFGVYILGMGRQACKSSTSESGTLMAYCRSGGVKCFLGWWMWALCLRKEPGKEEGGDNILSFEIPLRCFSLSEMNCCNTGSSLFERVCDEKRGERGFLLLKSRCWNNFKQGHKTCTSCIKLYKSIADYYTNWIRCATLEVNNFFGSQLKLVLNIKV